MINLDHARHEWERLTVDQIKGQFENTIHGYNDLFSKYADAMDTIKYYKQKQADMAVFASHILQDSGALEFIADKVTEKVRIRLNEKKDFEK